MTFDNIQTTIYQIRSIIKNNVDVRKLLYYDVNNPLSQADVPVSTIEDYIFVSPVFDTAITPYNKNSFITISLSKLKETDDQTYVGIIRVNVLSQLNLWPIANNKVRVLELVNKINNTLNNQKFASSNKLTFNQIELVVLDKNISGYSMIFDLTDGSGLENEF